jgi:hypothetical protein
MSHGGDTVMGDDIPFFCGKLPPSHITVVDAAAEHGLRSSAILDKHAFVARAIFFLERPRQGTTDIEEFLTLFCDALTQFSQTYAWRPLRIWKKEDRRKHTTIIWNFWIIRCEVQCNKEVSKS